jgi:hypothetical protein
MGRFAISWLAPMIDNIQDLTFRLVIKAKLIQVAIFFGNGLHEGSFGHVFSCRNNLQISGFQGQHLWNLSENGLHLTI